MGTWPEAEGVAIVDGEPMIAGTTIRVRDLRGFEVPGQEEWAAWVGVGYPELTAEQIECAIVYYEENGVYYWSIGKEAEDDQAVAR